MVEIEVLLVTTIVLVPVLVVFFILIGENNNEPKSDFLKIIYFTRLHTMIVKHEERYQAYMVFCYSAQIRK